MVAHSEALAARWCAHAGHLDMLHNSPNGAGLAWAGGNVYWYYDGYHHALARYPGTYAALLVQYANYKEGRQRLAELMKQRG